MTEYNEGDLVEAVKGDNTMRGRLDDITGGVLGLVEHGWPISSLTGGGWTVTVVERATPPLPTEPGTVIAIGDWWLVKLRPYVSGQSGAWEFLPVPESVLPSVKRAGQKDQCVYGNDWVRAEAEQQGGFTVISEPAPVTAKRVLERVVDVLYRGGVTRLPNEFGNLGAEFGVQP